MRRTAALFATALLAGAAALTASPAGAAPSTGGAPAAESSKSNETLAAENCSVTYNGLNVTGTCTGLDPYQTWGVGGWCTVWENGWQVSKPLWSPTVSGDGSVTGYCIQGGIPSYAAIGFGPRVPTGPTGPIVGYGNKCVGVKDGNTANGTPVQIWDCLGNTAQNWKMGADGTVRALGKCLDVQGGRTAQGTPVQVYDCNGTGAQQWQARADGSLYNPQSGRCLDEYAFSATNGGAIVIWDCNGYANQVWRVPA
ncbi:ricin-type beta-trefoil lectin domain protein [Kitasatospora sp. NPDC093806]|uniref:ricin-type beta-trefoil lectin domain protein n=1 Tax=Kitasatospora sp. NPDC093806 TaxID=3155075 RepID=UPI0034347F5C